MMHLTLTSILALGSALVADALTIFQNNGTTGGWDFTNKEHKGTVEEVENMVFGGRTSLKMTQIYDPSYTGRYHSEVGMENIYKLGDTGAYTVTFRLQDDWSFGVKSKDEQSYNLAQFIADFSDTKCDDYMPSSMIWIVGDQLYSRVKQNTVCNQKIQTFPNLAKVTAGAWHTVTIHASWKNDNTGFYKIWFDGKQVLDKTNLATTISDKRPFQYRVGLYANGWHDDKRLKGNQGTRSVWYANIAAGDTLNDVTFAGVDPVQ